ncbi:MAG: Fic family protein [Aeromicrobium erythreum]
MHPFVDGNGRIGRTLVHAVLRRRRVTRHLTVPLASALVAHRESYFDALGDYREGLARPIVAMLTAAVIVATHESRRTATHLHEIRTDWDARLGPVRRGSPVHRVLIALPEHPTVTVSGLADSLGLERDEVGAAVDALHAVQILEPAARGLGDRRRGRSEDRGVGGSRHPRRAGRPRPAHRRRQPAARRLTRSAVARGEQAGARMDGWPTRRRTA